MFPSFSHCPFFLTKTSPLSVLTYLSPSFPVSDVGSVFPFKISFPSSPFGPLMFPSFSHCPFFLTKTSPLSVLTYLSPSFPVSDVGSVFPFKMSFPSSPFGPLMFPAGFHMPFSFTKTSPVLVLTNVSPSFPWFSPGFSVPFKISFPSRPS